jgi:hypothetical protein
MEQPKEVQTIGVWISIKGGYTCVDREHVEYLELFNLRVDDTGRGKKRVVMTMSASFDYRYLHEWVAKRPPGLVVDHLNEDGLDNRRCNLECVTNAENTRRYYRRRRERQEQALARYSAG